MKKLRTRNTRAVAAFAKREIAARAKHAPGPKVRRREMRDFFPRSKRHSFFPRQPKAVRRKESPKATPGVRAPQSPSRKRERTLSRARTLLLGRAFRTACRPRRKPKSQSWGESAPKPLPEESARGRSSQERTAIQISPPPRAQARLREHLARRARALFEHLPKKRKWPKQLTESEKALRFRLQTFSFLGRRKSGNSLFRA